MLKGKALFICMTPLQILIAKSIISDKKIENCNFLIFYYNDNTKYKYYINLLKKKGFDYDFYEIKSKTKAGRLLELFKIKKFINKIKNRKFEDIYVSSINNALIHTALQELSFYRIFTFDDGLANLYKDSGYYIDKEVKIQKFIKRILGVSWSLKLIKSSSQMHYSIYKDKDNIINEVTYINLQTSSNILDYKGKKEVLKIYIGQPLYEVDDCFTQEFLIKVLSEIGVDYYFPHPRESLNGNFNYIESNLILEDYYVEISRNYEVHFYTFFSTAIINIGMMDENLKSYVLFNDYLMKKYKSVYHVFDFKSYIDFVNIGEINE